MILDDLTTLRCFKLIFENRSITKTSKALGLSKAAVSKRLDAFELKLGIALFSRTTRTITPTSKSNDMIILVNEILDKIDALSENIIDYKVDKIKKIKITCISTMAKRYISKIICDYQKENPLIQVELIVTDSVLDMTEHNIDLSVRINPPKNLNLIGKKVGEYQLVVVGSHKLKNIKVKNVSELVHYPLLFIDHHRHVFPSAPKDFCSKLIDSRRFITNDSSLVTQILLREEHVAVRSLWDVKDYIAQKKLKLVLPIDYFKKSGDIWVISNKNRLESSQVRSLYEYISKELKQQLA